MPSSTASLERIALVDVMRELHALCGESVDYNQVWRVVTRGDVPAERIRGRWHLIRSDVPRVAEALGMTCRSTAA